MVKTQDHVARDMKAHLPLDVVAVITDDAWKGGPLVVLQGPMGALGHPPATILGKNYVWLMPFVKYYPWKARWFKTQSHIITFIGWYHFCLGMVRFNITP